jgi:hypothetical protein
VWVNKNPEFMTAFYQPAIEQVIAHQPINLLTDTVEANGFKGTKDRNHLLSDEEHQTLVLLSFYTPHLGKQINDFIELPDQSYAWTRSISPQLVAQTHSIGKVQGWQLIQKSLNR